MTNGVERTKTELKPCPFCGERHVMHEQGHVIITETARSGPRFGVRCYSCGGRIEFFETEAEAIEAWNTRAATTVGKVQVEIEPALRGTLTAEQVREAVESSSWAETSSIREFNDSSWQAIADELNSRAERTCRMEYNEDWSGDELYPTEAYQCSVCGRITQEGLPGYCPRCGAKVVDE